MFQQSLFDAEPPEWEVDAQAERLVATIVLPSGAPGEYDYEVPGELADERIPEALVEPGRRVRAPMGRGDRLVTGYCVDLGTKQVGSLRKLKRLHSVVDQESLVSPAMLRMTRWMADRYLASWGQVLEAVIPAGVRGRAGTREATLLSVPTGVAAKITRIDLPEKQRHALETLAASSRPLSAKQLSAAAGCTPAPINALRKRGLIEARRERVESDERIGSLDPLQRQPPKQLTADQQRCLDMLLEPIDDGRHDTVLVHGVTGSGKTEVYIQAIERVVSFGRQAIVLVPEISLTPQTVGRFRERFDRVAVLHSHQSDIERRRHWKRIAAGEVQVVVGARSAIFAPTPHLGLVVIDEEHESSFKQDTTPRYHAREVALFRAREESVPLVLASATPSLESWLRAAADSETDERYRLAEMPRRVGGRPMPDVRVVDLRIESASGARGAISRPLHHAMEQTLRDEGQVILLLNRRGFSTHLQCPACGFVQKCEHCDVAMTFHREWSSVVCHWCDHRASPPRVCPDCGSPKIRYGGLGTQKLEAEVAARFPGVAVARMDSDTMRRPGSHEAALDAFRRGETRVLVGTQMIAKGLDFPEVTLVGVVSADSALHLADFRAAERTFQLVTQVAGRTGRGDRGGRVVVQTFEPDHPAIRAAVHHDYAAFAASEAPQREALGYPPYGTMARVIARGESEPPVKAYLEALDAKIAAFAEQEGLTLRRLGPAPAPIAKIRGELRLHLQLQSPSSEGLRTAIRQAWESVVSPDGVRAIVDIDPIDML